MKTVFATTPNTHATENGHWDEERTAKRTEQGVEGYDKPHKD